ncbi:MAG: hypothetical protein D8H96_09335 [Lautropia sp.]|jgi:hypothetical protein|uniref:Uncharacterized protein n=1 Tax=Lautropia dentalis TaxID=2490857 RepID=A0A3R8NQL3_9BURK|nr:hypothetical protein [Lautropia dentalis]RKW41662.1 MAG: hypothetical protein D8H96_09335 [Lautropia sp.]RRN43605.1 hypothetical protein EHV23_09205 [Lautropia dentalis]
MNSGTVKIVDRLSAVEAINQMSEEDLVFLNRLIIERCKLIRQARATVQMTRFNVGDRVSFIAHGEDKEGTVIRLNKKTVSIAVDDGHQWNVAPGLLKLVQSAGDELWLG